MIVILKILKRYKVFLVLIIINLLLLLLKPEIGTNSFKISLDNLLEMFIILPPIFILLGLLDIWVQRETMIKLMGKKSGILGIIMAFLLGSVAAGPLYAAFPIAGVLLKKGSKFTNILIFIGAWSTTKIPMLLFETSSMGWKFMLARFIINIPGIILIAYIINKLIISQEEEFIYNSAKMID